MAERVALSQAGVKHARIGATKVEVLFATSSEQVVSSNKLRSEAEKAFGRHITYFGNTISSPSILLANGHFVSLCRP